MNKITTSPYAGKIAINIYGDETYRAKQIVRFINYGAVAPNATATNFTEGDFQVHEIGPDCCFFLTNEEMLVKALTAESWVYLRTSGKSRLYPRSYLKQLIQTMVATELASMETEVFYR